jgi:chemotaxis protein CheX
MDVQFINPVLKALTEVLATMARMEVKPGKVVRKERDDPVSGKNVTGLMSMANDEAIASIALTFSEPVILEIANKMLPEPKHSVDGMVIDLVGELANMVMGGAKRNLEEEGYAFNLSLPTVIMGSDYLIAHRTRAPILVLPFRTLQGEFFVEASYERAKKSSG